MDIAVVVPWRPDGAHRDAAWEWVSHRWAATHPDWPVIEGSCPDGPWRKAVAVNDALSRTGADLIVLADADVWCDGVTEAVEVVSRSGGWAIPHRLVHRLSQAATRQVLDGAPLGGQLAGAPYVGYPGGGMTVLERGLLEHAPMDPRFAGWGQEDEAAAAAWQTLAGDPWRGTADLWHLWHVPEPRLTRKLGSTASARLWRRYRQALNEPALMGPLLAEAREVLYG